MERKKSRCSYFVSFTGALLALALPLAASIAFNSAISKPDLRELAGSWVVQNIKPGSKIATEHYSIPFDAADYSVQDVIRISDHDLAWYQEQGFDVLIISDGVWDLLRRHPKRYAEKLAVYDQLVTNSTLLAEFVPEPPAIAVSGYPTVGIYHFAPVRIYRLPNK